MRDPDEGIAGSLEIRLRGNKVWTGFGDNEAAWCVHGYKGRDVRGEVLSGRALTGCEQGV
ncbi:hypothetical protein GCM10027157_17220 [Corynebacterium aquatimens]